MKNRGLLLILSSPSGAGKTSIAKEILQNNSNISLSVSVTTRKPRSNEIDGKDYIFINESQYHEMVKNNELLEHAKVFNNFYGTPKQAVLDALAKGQDMLFDIDWQGTQQLSDALPSDIVKIFILPPSKRELERRLWGRAQDTAEVVHARMAKASEEMSHYAEYDWVIINEDLASSVAQVQSIYQSERLKRARLIGIKDFIEDLTK